MGLITTVRAQMPTAGSAPAQAQDAPARQTSGKEAASVADPLHKSAVLQSSSSESILFARLAERDESDHPATEARIAAEAARDAYLRASLAAGVSPLPLSGI